MQMAGNRPMDTEHDFILTGKLATNQEIPILDELNTCLQLEVTEK